MTTDSDPVSPDVRWYQEKIEAQEKELEEAIAEVERMRAIVPRCKECGAEIGAVEFVCDEHREAE